MRFDRTALADHFQFHLRDGQAAYAFPEEWPAPARDDRVLTAPGAIGVRAAKNWFVPVTIVIAETEPVIEADAWDHIVLAPLALPSGGLLLGGGPLPVRDQPALALAPGTWQALVLSGNLDRSAPDAEGDDYYKVVLWPGDGALAVRKRWVPRPE